MSIKKILTEVIIFLPLLYIWFIPIIILKSTTEQFYLGNLVAFFLSLAMATLCAKLHLEYKKSRK